MYHLAKYELDDTENRIRTAVTVTRDLVGVMNSLQHLDLIKLFKK